MISNDSPDWLFGHQTIRENAMRIRRASALAAPVVAVASMLVRLWEVVPAGEQSVRALFRSPVARRYTTAQLSGIREYRSAVRSDIPPDSTPRHTKRLFAWLFPPKALARTRCPTPYGLSELIGRSDPYVESRRQHRLSRHKLAFCKTHSFRRRRGLTPNRKVFAIRG